MLVPHGDLAELVTTLRGAAQVHLDARVPVLEVGPAPQPQLLQIDAVRPVRRVGQRLGRLDPGDPVGAVGAVAQRQQVPASGRLDEADRIDDAFGRLRRARPARVGRAVAHPQPGPPEDRPLDGRQRRERIGLGRVAQQPAVADQHPSGRAGRLGACRLRQRRHQFPDCRRELAPQAERPGGGRRSRGQQGHRLAGRQAGQVGGEAGQQREATVPSALGVDRDPRRGERLDVAQDGPLRDLQLGRERGRGRATAVPQQQHEREQPVRAHGSENASNT